MSYKRNSLKPEYWKKAYNPLNTTFSFEELNTDVKVEPMNDVLPKKALAVVYDVFESGHIEQHGCYSNSVIVSEALRKEAGIIVHCIDGFCTDESGSYLHRFCEYNGRFFDASIELLGSSSEVLKRKYYAVRSFDSQELIAIMFAYAKVLNSSRQLYTGSTLPSNDERACGVWDNAEIYVDDNGRIAFV